MSRTTKHVAHYKSETQKGVAYTTTRHRDGAVTCTCPGFMYSAGKVAEGIMPKNHKLCKHAVKARTWK